MILSGKKIFFVGAHPDDIEIGCGALIANVVNKAEVFCITLSDNQKNPQLKNIVREYNESMDILGVDKKHRYLKSFETRRFKHARQEILEFLLSMNNKYKPDIVFVHSDADLHQDHNTVTQESLRAFRGISLFGYDVIRSSHGFFPTLLIEVNKEDIDKKINSLAAYKTYAEKYYFSPELTYSIL
ncbi:MAG: PIG-L family deacetylase, partial [Anaerolineaceae bacterium]|nr:PIG-L family deacetylase [Anaerolineaceae bacterium]